MPAIPDYLKKHIGSNPIGENPQKKYILSDPIGENPLFKDTQGYQDIISHIGSTGYSGGSKQGGVDIANRWADQFSGIFKNLTGQDPTADDYNKFFQNVGQGIIHSPKGFGGSDYNDIQNLTNQYAQNQYGKQIGDYQQQQQQKQFQTGQDQIQKLIDEQNKKTLDYLQRPEVTEQFKRSYNQGGMLNSGAFEQGLADRLSGSVLQNQSAALGGFGIPSIQNESNTANAPYQGFIQNLYPGMQNYGQGQTSQFGFNQQKQLSGDLANMMQPGNLQQWAPIIQGALQGGGLAASGTYLCTHLKKLGLATKEEIDLVHDKLVNQFFSHPAEMLLYALLAPPFIADSDGFDWASLKSRIVDDILSEEDSLTAFNRYRDVCIEIFSAKELCHA